MPVVEPRHTPCRVHVIFVICIAITLNIPAPSGAENGCMRGAQGSAFDWAFDLESSSGFLMDPESSASCPTLTAEIQAPFAIICVPSRKSHLVARKRSTRGSLHVASYPIWGRKSVAPWRAARRRFWAPSSPAKPANCTYLDPPRQTGMFSYPSPEFRFLPDCLYFRGGERPHLVPYSMQ